MGLQLVNLCLNLFLSGKEETQSCSREWGQKPQHSYQSVCCWPWDTLGAAWAEMTYNKTLGVILALLISLGFCLLGAQ